MKSKRFFSSKAKAGNVPNSPLSHTFRPYFLCDTQGSELKNVVFSLFRCAAAAVLAVEILTAALSQSKGQQRAQLYQDNARAHEVAVIAALALGQVEQPV